MTFHVPLMCFLGMAGSALAAEPQVKISASGDSIRVTGSYFALELSATQPQLVSLAVDNLGKGAFKPNSLQPPPAAAQKSVAKLSGATVEYRRDGLAATSPARWAFGFDGKTVRMASRWSEADPPEPILLNFDLNRCHATLLGLMGEKAMPLPALLHLPDQGSFRITSTDARASLPYDARRAVGPFAKITFPPATKETPRVEYRWEAVAIYPAVKGTENDPRFDGFRRNWLNIFQVNPRLGVLANHSASDSCASCPYMYADIAVHTPPLADGLTSLDMIRHLLDRYVAGMPGYGFPGWIAFDLPGGPSKNPIFLDAYPSLLIAAADYVAGSGNRDWLKANYDALRKWTDALLAMDHDGNGLFEYACSGDSGSWTPYVTTRPANWWDTVGFGHEDAYSNALAYRALRGMEEMAADLDKPADAARYRQAAGKLHDVYFKTFYNPATGVLAGWKSADGQLHDYYFLFVNGLAIHNGLVPAKEANAIVDKLLAKMKAVGFTRFELGLPGNLVPIARRDYVHLDPRFGGGAKEDNSDGFQIYENGGATACHAFHFLAALYELGRREEADRILFPMLAAFEKGDFQGVDANGLTNDWRAWDGAPHGYEGLLVDGYYTLLAVIVRDGGLRNAPAAPGSERLRSEK